MLSAFEVQPVASSEPTTQRVLPAPDPTGWFSVGLSRDVPPGAVVTRRFFDGEIVLYRSEAGELRATDPFCPHLGAHLGHGGKVVGERIRCPFHSFEFDRNGACAHVPYGDKTPPKARLAHWPVREVHGIILVFHHPRRLAPDWDVPDIDPTGWRPLSEASWDLDSHPQETSENSVDIGHFAVVHGYEQVREVERATAEGPLLRARYAMIRPHPLGFGVQAEFQVWVWGLGFSFVEIEVPGLGLQFRNFILATPIGGGRMTMRIASSMKGWSQDDERPWFLRALPGFVMQPLLHRFGMQSLAHDVLQDFEIWGNKSCLARPALARGDGPVGLYRQWVRQFYRAGALAAVPEAT